MIPPTLTTVGTGTAISFIALIALGAVALAQDASQVLLVATPPPTGPPPPTCSGTLVLATAGAIQAAVNAHAINTTFCLAAGTYHEQVIPKAGDVFWGAGIGQTIVDGQNNLAVGFCSINPCSSGGSGIASVTLKFMTIQNYTDTNVAGPSVGGSISGAGWTVTNNDIANAGTINLLASFWVGGLIQDNLIHGAVNLNGIDCLNDTNTVFNNNDIYNNNTAQTTPNNASGQASQIKCNGGSYTWTNNHIHNGWGNGLWLDSETTAATITGNEVNNNPQACVGVGGCGGGGGIEFEIGNPVHNSQTTPIFIVQNNYVHDNPFSGIGFTNSGNADVSNNALVNNGDGLWGSFALNDEGNRTDQPPCNNFGCIDINIAFHNNFIAHSGPAGNTRVFFGFDDGTPGAAWKTSNNTFTSNTYYLANNSQQYFESNGSYLSSTSWLALPCCGGTPDANSTFVYNGGALPSGVGPRGGFVCKSTMGSCP
jgi:hypothetical protein